MFSKTKKELFLDKKIDHIYFDEEIILTPSTGKIVFERGPRHVNINLDTDVKNLKKLPNFDYYKYVEEYNKRDQITKKFYKTFCFNFLNLANNKNLFIIKHDHKYCQSLRHDIIFEKIITFNKQDCLINIVDYKLDNGLDYDFGIKNWCNNYENKFIYTSAVLNFKPSPSKLELNKNLDYLIIEVESNSFQINFDSICDLNFEIVKK